MKSRILYSFMLFLLTFSLTGCNAISTAISNVFATESAEVSLLDMEILGDPDNPENEIIGINLNIKNTGEKEWHLYVSSFSMSSSDGLIGDQVTLYGDELWEQIDSMDIAPDKRTEGSVYFRVARSVGYKLTYSKNDTPIEFTIPSDVDAFEPSKQNLEI